MRPRCNGSALQAHEERQFSNSRLTASELYEVRANGEGMVQSRTTGSTISCLWQHYADHARLPVMMPRKSDSDMCRGGSKAARKQPANPADEHGRLHGVSDLQCFAVLRRAASNSDCFTMMERKRRWRMLGKRLAQLRWQDKARFLAGRTSVLSHCLHIVFWTILRSFAKQPYGRFA
jgi:hypothetical protein